MQSAVAAHRLPATQPMNVLVADDSAQDRLLMEAFLRSAGHRSHLAGSGRQVLECFDAERIDLVIMDVVMSGMNGIEATASLRARCAERWIPILLVSAVENQAELMRGLEQGADDYLVKPLDFDVARAKIRSLQRIAAMNRKLVQDAESLQHYRDKADEELRIATGLIGNLVDRDGLEDRALLWSVTPSQGLSGDVAAAARCSGGDLYVMLADATGHGLAAIISVLPVLQVFYGMARKGMPLARIAREMNLRLREYVPVGRYVATVLLRIERAVLGKVEIWNGGMPGGLCWHDGVAGALAALEPRHLPLGILDDARFDARCTTVHTVRNGRLVFFSDGMIEAADAAGEQFGVLRLLASLRGASAEVAFRAALEALHTHCAGEVAHDDASLLMISLADV